MQLPPSYSEWGVAHLRGVFMVLSELTPQRRSKNDTSSPKLLYNVPISTNGYNEYTAYHSKALVN